MGKPDLTSSPDNAKSPKLTERCRLEEEPKDDATKHLIPLCLITPSKTTYITKKTQPDPSHHKINDKMIPVLVYAADRVEHESGETLILIHVTIINTRTPSPQRISEVPTPSRFPEWEAEERTHGILAGSGWGGG